MRYECLKVERRGEVAWITLNRPQALNSLSPQMVEELGSALDDVERDPAARVCVFTAQGRAFSAGGDLKTMDSFAAQPETAAARIGAYLESITGTLRRIELLSKPTVAMVNGLAFAGGLELVLCCDIVLASDEALFGDAHAKYGLLPGGGGSVRLPRKIGVSRAKYLMLTGDQVSARTMCEWGLVAAVHPAGELAAATLELASRLATYSPLGLARMKRLVDDGLEQPVDAALRAEQAVVALHNHSADLREGLSAFRERREPAFAGK